MSALEKSARGEDCTVNVAGVCNYNPETVVLAHLRFGGFGGMGKKPHSLIAVYACHACHDWLDGRVAFKGAWVENDWNFYALRALARTHMRMAERGILTVRKSA